MMLHFNILFWNSIAWCRQIYNFNLQLRNISATFHTNHIEFCTKTSHNIWTLLIYLDWNKREKISWCIDWLRMNWIPIKLHLVGNRFYVIRNNTCYKMITRKWSDSLRRIYAVCERVPPRIADGLRIRDGERHKIYSTVYCGYLSSSKLRCFWIYFTKDINHI